MGDLTRSVPENHTDTQQPKSEKMRVLLFVCTLLLAHLATAAKTVGDDENCFSCFETCHGRGDNTKTECAKCASHLHEEGLADYCLTNLYEMPEGSDTTEPVLDADADEDEDDATCEQEEDT